MQRFIYYFLVTCLICGFNSVLFAESTPTMPDAPKYLTIQQSDIINFANKAALSVFNYDFKNYENHLKQVSVNFTPEGWRSYEKALLEANNLEAIKRFQMQANAKINGETRILKQETVKNIAIWIVQSPIAVQYQIPQQKEINHEYDVMMVIVKDLQNPNSALGIKQLIAKPVVK